MACFRNLVTYSSTLLLSRFMSRNLCCSNVTFPGGSKYARYFAFTGAILARSSPHLYMSSVSLLVLSRTFQAVLLRTTSRRKTQSSRPQLLNGWKCKRVLLRSNWITFGEYFQGLLRTVHPLLLPDWIS